MADIQHLYGFDTIKATEDKIMSTFSGRPAKDVIRRLRKNNGLENGRHKTTEDKGILTVTDLQPELIGENTSVDNTIKTDVETKEPSPLEKLQSQKQTISDELFSLEKESRKISERLLDSQHKLKEEKKFFEELKEKLMKKKEELEKVFLEYEKLSEEKLKKREEIQSKKAELQSVEENIIKLQTIKINFSSCTDEMVFDYVAADFDISTEDIKSKVTEIAFTNEISDLLEEMSVSRVKTFAKYLIILEKTEEKNNGRVVEAYFSENDKEIAELMEFIGKRIKVV